MTLDGEIDLLRGRHFHFTVTLIDKGFRFHQVFLSRGNLLALLQFSVVIQRSVLMLNRVTRMSYTDSYSNYVCQLFYFLHQ
jgi:hypothetical protein